MRRTTDDKMNAYDWICLVVIALLAIRGMFKGFLEEFSKKAGLIVGIVLAILFTGILTGYLSNLIIRWNLGIWGSLIIAAILLVIGYVGTHFLTGIMDDLFQIGRMGLVNHILGLAFGAFEGVVIVLLLSYALRFQKIIPIENIFVGSLVIEKLTPILLWMLKIDIQSYLQDFNLRGE